MRGNIAQLMQQAQKMQENLQRAFGGVLRHFVLGEPGREGQAPVGVFTDDERPLILREGKASSREAEAPDGERQ